MAKEIVGISAIWTRRDGDHVETLAEIDGVFRVVSRDLLDSQFSHIAEAAGHYRWPLDPVTQRTKL